MNLKSWVTIIANIGGLIALVDFGLSLVSYFGRITASLGDVWDVKSLSPKGTLHNAHVVFTNNSSKSVFIYSMKLLADDEAFIVPTSGGYLMTKKYDEYEYPIFRTSFPITLPPHSTIDTRIEVQGDVVWSKLTDVEISTQGKQRKIHLSIDNWKPVNQYQFR